MAKKNYTIKRTANGYEVTERNGKYSHICKTQKEASWLVKYLNTL